MKLANTIIFGCLVFGLLFFLSLENERINDTHKLLNQDLGLLGPTLVELNGAAREQRIYIKATSKAAAIDTIRAGKLVNSATITLNKLGDDLDALSRRSTNLIDHIDSSQIMLVDSTQKLLSESTKQVNFNGEELTKNLKSVEPVLDDLGKTTKEINVIANNINEGVIEGKETAKDIHHLADTAVIVTDPLKKAKNRFLEVIKFIAARFVHTI